MESVETSTLHLDVLRDLKREERTEFVYLLRWPAERTKTEACASFAADEEWDEIKRATRDRVVLWAGSRIGFSC